MHCLSVFGFLLKQDNNRNYYSVIHGLYSLSHLIRSKPLGNYYYCHFMDGFPDSSVGKESACHAGDPCSIPKSGRSAGEGIGYPLQYSWASLVAQMVKNPPAMWETWVWSLGWEDPLKKGKATQGLQRVGRDFHFHFLWMGKLTVRDFNNVSRITWLVCMSMWHVEILGGWLLFSYCVIFTSETHKHTDCAISDACVGMFNKFESLHT